MPGLRPAPSYLGSEWNNRDAWADMPKTADSRVLNSTYLRSKAAHDLLMQAQAQQAEEDNNLLATATPDEQANLFGQPRTERELRLQKIVQRDINAKERGASLIPNEKQKVAYAQSLANLKRTNLANYLNPLKFGLDQDRFGETMNQNDRGYLNQLAQRQHATQQLAAQERFRQVQAKNAAANLAQRGIIQNQNFGQRQQFHVYTKANQELQAMMEYERMLQAKAEDEQRQKNFEAGFNRDYFGTVAGAADRGALTPDQLSQFQSAFDPGSMAILKGYANLGAGKTGWTAPGPTPGSPAPSGGYLSASASGVGPFGWMGQGSHHTQSGDIDWGTDDYGDEGGDEFGMGSDFTPPPVAPQMAARPMAPAPQRQQQQFRPGSTVRDPRTGRQFLVLPNGQFRPL